MQEVTDKYTLKPATYVAMANAETIAEAARLAEAARDGCRKMKPYERKKVLNAVAKEVNML